VRGTLTEREHRRVDMFLDMRQSEEPPDRGDVAVRHRIAERLDVALLQMLNEHRPGCETGFARDGELRVRELQRPPLRLVANDRIGEDVIRLAYVPA
jgi:hypothetical protein